MDEEEEELEKVYGILDKNTLNFDDPETFSAEQIFFKGKTFDEIIPIESINVIEY